MKKLDVPQSGSQSDTTASRNRFGQYNRTRATPVNPNTARQVLVRSRLGAASQAWRDLTNDERAGWNAWAAVNGRVDSLGQTIYPSGHQRFVGAYGLLSDAGFAGLPSVPTVSADPAPTLTALSAIDDGTLELTCTTTVSTTHRLVVFASPMLSAGVSFNGDFRFIQAFSAALTTNIADIAAAYQAKFGPLLTNQRIFVQAFMVTEAGLSSLASAINSVVEAAP